MVKNTPIRMRFCESIACRPARSGVMRNRAMCTSGSVPLFSRCCCHLTKSQSTTPPAAMTNGVRAKPNGVAGRVLRLEPAPDAGLEHGVDDEAEPRGRQHGAEVVEAGLLLRARRVGEQAQPGEDQQHEHDLAEEHDPPRQLGGGPTAEDRAHGDAGAGDAADDGVGGRPVAALVVAGDERGQGGQHQRRADALEDRPAEGQLGHGLRDRGQRRAAAVDHQADGEGPAAADDVADLAAGEHQHRHHQRVEGDDGLDGGDGGVEVGDELADRHVHDGLVEHHHELRGGKDDQRTPLLHRRCLHLTGYQTQGRRSPRPSAHVSVFLN